MNSFSLTDFISENLKLLNCGNHHTSHIRMAFCRCFTVPMIGIEYIELLYSFFWVVPQKLASAVGIISCKFLYYLLASTKIVREIDVHSMQYVHNTVHFMSHFFQFAFNLVGFDSWVNVSHNNSVCSLIL